MGSQPSPLIEITCTYNICDQFLKKISQNQPLLEPNPKFRRGGLRPLPFSHFDAPG